MRHFGEKPVFFKPFARYNQRDFCLRWELLCKYKKEQTISCSFSLAAKQTLAALKLTNQGGWNAARLYCQRIDPSILGDIKARADCLCQWYKRRQLPITCSTIFSPIMATGLLPTALAAIFPAASVSSFARTPRGRAMCQSACGYGV